MKAILQGIITNITQKGSFYIGNINNVEVIFHQKPTLKNGDLVSLNCILENQKELIDFSRSKLRTVCRVASYNRQIGDFMQSINKVIVNGVICSKSQFGALVYCDGIYIPVLSNSTKSSFIGYMVCKNHNIALKMADAI